MSIDRKGRTSRLTSGLHENHQCHRTTSNQTPRECWLDKPITEMLLDAGVVIRVMHEQRKDSR